ncbi:TetR/AcrR family transcriptional regulator [Nonomuraea sp. ATR24]|uniref:TetR/AcrR family transcriptional regulator n=1 Tax=Nonomuraea TaxID=83681 RepID=UPI001C5F255A|nr:TetR/AcrR family transcriptional regulator [Nonomuraea ceibae]
MATSARRGAPLTLGEIHAAALRMVDEGGVDALSMRKLAAELDVNPMSLYHHVPSKEALIQQICVGMANRLELPPDDGTPWQEQLRALALAYHALARAYPALFAYAYAHQQPGIAHEGGIWGVLHRILRAAGVPGPDVERTGDVLHAFMSGFVLAETKGLIAEPGPAFDTVLDLIVHGLAHRPA